jgi:hypothetical protein
MKTVVIDANIGVSIAIQLPYSELAFQKMTEWHRNGANRSTCFMIRGGLSLRKR